jgi:predicted O-linked N-acetylglucosamine transferase (SPINDLY family)
LPTIDYYLSADAFEPGDAQENYSEKLVTLPNLGCYYEPLDIAREPLSLDELGLPNDEPLYVCPGTPFKYAPRHDWIYPAIARRLGRCRFVFFKYPLETLSRRLMQRLRVAFADAGLRFEDHVVELPWLPKGRFASLMTQADAYLDTIGFSGFNSAMQAIECGLPVVTREGKYLRGRLASGILRVMGVSESTATDEREYVELATRLGIEPSIRDALKERIAQSRGSLCGDRASVGALQSFVAEAAASG